VSKGATIYSDTIEGAPENYHWPVAFDLTGGALGITQLEDRVLLSQFQMRELIKFLKRNDYEKL
jgi:hypothetical protein